MMGGGRIMCGRITCDEPETRVASERCERVVDGPRLADGCWVASPLSGESVLARPAGDPVGSASVQLLLDRGLEGLGLEAEGAGPALEGDVAAPADQVEAVG